MVLVNDITHLKKKCKKFWRKLHRFRFYMKFFERLICPLTHCAFLFLYETGAGKNLACVSCGQVPTSGSFASMGIYDLIVLPSFGISSKLLKDSKLCMCDPAFEHYWERSMQPLIAKNCLLYSIKKSILTKREKYYYESKKRKY